MSSNAATNSNQQGQRRSPVKKIGIAIGILATFLLGFHFGGNHYLSTQGYGDDDVYPLEDFVHNHLLPAFNESYESLMAEYYSDSDAGAGNETAPTTNKRPGELFQAANPNAKAKHPVLLIPGFITGGLEIWSAEKCLSKMFRQAIWGGTSMAKAFLGDKECWLRHMALDPLTGMDPSEEIRIRAQAGFEAADNFISSYWIFGKLIQSLADVGYLPKNMAMITYDWRMAFPLLEERDGFLTDFKLKVERMVEVNGEKAVLIGHSMGNTLVLFFLRWVCEPKAKGGGGGGSDWVDRHIHSFVNIGGPLLGVPKAVSALVSGEMRETALLGKLGPLLETYLGAKKRKDLIQTWASVWNMLPKGGAGLWEVGADLSKGQLTRLLEPSPTYFESAASCKNTEDGNTPDACTNPDINDAKPIKADRSFVSEEVAAIIEDFDHIPETNATFDDVLQFALDWGGGVGPKVAAGRYTSYRSGGPDADLKLSQWHNPVCTPLPNAPNFRIYCLYGVGVDTERGYVYKRNLDAETGTMLMDPPYIIDTEYHEPEKNISYGVHNADGDGSVPLLSLGYMCTRGWVKNHKLNPSKVEVITKEFKHEAKHTMSDPMRAGPKAGEHCDILGNEEMTLDILKVATGSESVTPRIISNIEEIADKIDSHDLGGLDYVSTAESKHPAGPVLP